MTKRKRRERTEEAFCNCCSSSHGRRLRVEALALGFEHVFTGFRMSVACEVYGRFIDLWGWGYTRFGHGTVVCNTTPHYHYCILFYVICEVLSEDAGTAIQPSSISDEQAHW
jgi:hypothetical protein